MKKKPNPFDPDFTELETFTPAEWQWTIDFVDQGKMFNTLLDIKILNAGFRFDDAVADKILAMGKERGYVPSPPDPAVTHAFLDGLDELGYY